MRLKYHHGSLVLSSPTDGIKATLGEHLQWDQRTSELRCFAYLYRQIIEAAHTQKVSIDDQSRSYQKLNLKLKEKITPRDHQKEALARWSESGFRGTTVIPTGGGKTILAMMAIEKVARSTLIVVPTIDLMHQWLQVAERFFDQPVGLLGGGYHEIKEITIATYDSAQIHCERLGHLFAFHIYDECHHLPGEQYQRIAKTSIAPFRLALTATIERSDGKEELIYELAGPLIYEGQVKQLIGHGLAPYDVITKEIPLTQQEMETYQLNRQIYIQFLRQNRISMGSRNGWSQFLTQSSRSAAGRQAFQAYLKQKKIAQASDNKLECIFEILSEHIGQRTIIFTDDNDMAYRIGAQFFLPVLTHKTKVKERKKMLDEFKQGNITCLVTSKVLNEGVDVPEAKIGVVVSGSGTVREHVQRLGRILRAQKGKRATLYELIAKDTSEYFVNQRRKEHHAYEEPAQAHFEER